MAIHRRHFALGAAASTLASPLHVLAQAGAFPNHPLRIVCPFAPGGGSDFMARTAAQILSERLGQPTIVENRPGAGGMLGTEYAVRTSPDGYTLLLVAGSYTVNPALYKLNFDPVKDIAPVIQLSRGAYVLCVNPKVPAKSLQELLDLARRQPGKLSFASAGTGSHLHIVTEYLFDMAKVKCTHVPYKGTGPAINDLLAGTVDMLFAGTEALMQHVKAGRLRALAVGTRQRLAAYPDIPSVAESGLPDYDVIAWHGLVAPRNVPPAIVARINAELNTGLRHKDLEARLEPTGVSAAGGTPEQFGALLQTEIVRYGKVVRDADIKPG
ncbi:tripartite tricarboxylate transporter substrate binding protein [Xylophilus sp. GOD-11R]|uniref:Bug family tripartite tricarboxylate transporter substrate binding protein n=1 Tax=Xylophilus sp. GOD-11R TaxID=3089814 RepID=UPI00298D153F|nr:tripartite tricarboxylate transporter substrate binding protein [Xylophilus sp. GOD-11R]WPB59100.1 tripartite tricarboxylate transporter substrate binding protein [Xylophilus sp. GOD-11R]